jgi:hypothetical protein
LLEIDPREMQCYLRLRQASLSFIDFPKQLDRVAKDSTTLV